MIQTSEEKNLQDNDGSSTLSSWSRWVFHLALAVICVHMGVKSSGNSPVASVDEPVHFEKWKKQERFVEGVPLLYYFANCNLQLFTLTVKLWKYNRLRGTCKKSWKVKSVIKYVIFEIYNRSITCRSSPGLFGNITSYLHHIVPAARLHLIITSKLTSCETSQSLNSVVDVSLLFQDEESSKQLIKV